VTLLTAFARAEAAAAGRAQRIRTVRHVHLGRHPLVVIPLQLAGEACAPLAVMLGDAPDKARLLTVYEPRDRARRFEFAADLAEVILGHLDGYLPAQLGDDEIAAIVTAGIQQTGASGMKAMGQVMKVVTPQTTGRADGGRVAAEVRRQLASQD